jgi:hypothetical protein
MTIAYAWKYSIAHCLIESVVVDDDKTAREAVGRIEDVLVPLIAADECEGGKR